MNQEYSEFQMKQDLATLGIEEGSSFTLKFLTGKFKNLARVQHPDKKGGSKEAFQRLKNAYDRLSDMLSNGMMEDDDNYESEFFKKSNFPLEKKTCFVVILENKFANNWEYTLKDIYGEEKALDNGGIQFKVESITVSFYNKPKKDNKTKVLIQGKNKEGISNFVFETMPKIYRRVISMEKKELPDEKKEISCDNCDYKSSDIPVLREHIDVEHIIPYRKKIQQKIISAYKCDECAFSATTRSTLRTHVNSSHKKQKQLKSIEVTKANSTNKKNKMNNVKFCCQVCGVVLQLEDELTQHMKGHSEDTVSQVIEEMLCNVCEQVFNNTADIRNHTNTQHSTTNKVHVEDNEAIQVESLFSCKQCEYDSDNSESLNMHNYRNIHDVYNLNKTLEETTETTKQEDVELIEKWSCYLCKYETNDPSKFDDHGFSKHGIIQCDKCEYKAEDNDILKKHKMNHTGRILFSCGICEFESSKQSMLVDHKESKHISKEKANVYCSRCEKEFSQSFLLKSHTCIPMFKYPCDKCSFVAISVIERLEHLEKIHIKNVAQCTYCEFKAKNQENLKVHVIEKHETSSKSQNIGNEKCSRNTEKEGIETKSAFICGQCGLNFESLELCSNHINSHSFKCYKCDFESDESSEVKKHELSEHGPLKCNQEETSNEINNEEKQKEDIIQFKCDQCSLSMHTEEELRKHKSTHENQPVPLGSSQPQMIKCDQCSYIAEDVAMFVKHIRNVHTAEHCRYCEYIAKDREDLQTHLIDDHEELVVLHSMAQQVDVIRERFELFETFKDELSVVIKAIAETQNAVKQELFLIRNKQAELSSANPGPTEEEKIAVPKATETDGGQSKANPNKKDKPKTYASKVSMKHKAQDDEVDFPSKILMVGDSHSYKLDRKLFEGQTDTNLDIAIAFTVDEDIDARYKSKNFLKVVPERLCLKSYDTLILQGGCNEISNIKLGNSGHPENVEIWEDKVKKSRLKLFRLAENSLKTVPSLKKVIILKSLPRYDPSEQDLSSIKSKLNKFGNSLYDSFWMKSGCPANIQISDQQLDCQGPLREKRFGNPGCIGVDGKPWDGIHMRGKMATRHYSNSMIRILNELRPKKKDNFHQSCPQTFYQQNIPFHPKSGGNYQYQNRRYRNRDNSGFRQPQQMHTDEGLKPNYNEYTTDVNNRFSRLGNF